MAFEKLKKRYQLIKEGDVPKDTFAMDITVHDKKGILKEITSLIYKYNGNIIYLQAYLESEGISNIEIEIEALSDPKKLQQELSSLQDLIDLKVVPTFQKVYGKRVIVIGGGAQVSQVVLGAVSESDRHNIRGERISVDTIPLVGEDTLADAVRAVGRLPRASILVLAGSIMGGKISDAITEIREKYGIPVIALNMVGNAKKCADIIVTDPVQAGVMAVMAISSKAKFDLLKMQEKQY